MSFKLSFTIPALVAISLCLLGGTVPAAADIINVPGDAPTIQGGINLAVNGDEVVVAEGIYVENINFNGKAIELRSVNPLDPAVVAATIIDGGGVNTVVTCDSGEGSDTILSGFTITGGFSGGEGGGMHNNGSSPTVTYCTFTANTAQYGGGMGNELGSNPTVINCTFSDNSAINNGGGMDNYDGSNPTVINCVFSFNYAVVNGGGMNNESNSNPTVTNCTFGGNLALTSGGGIYNYDNSNTTVTNCILWGDSPNEIFNSASTPIVTYCDVMGGYTGAGNINVDPHFVDPDGADDTPGTLDDNLRLNRYSPCTDAADNTAPDLIGITEDLDGNPRFVDDAGIVDTGIGSAPIVDMGAYECQINSFPNIINLTTDDSIQETIDDPQTLEGDEIVLNMGTYNQAINLNGMAITIRSTDPNDPAVVAATILDGTGLGTSIITCDSGETASSVISGLTITNANVVDDGGGGMYNDNSSPTVTNCTFSGNSATTYMTGSGGGMYNYNSDPTVTNCTFSGNSAFDGGGMYNDYGSSPTVTNCTFSGNDALYGGGGMANVDSSPTVTNCTFSSNEADYGGGMYNDTSSPTVTNCTFSENTSYLDGGGMYN